MDIRFEKETGELHHCPQCGEPIEGVDRLLMCAPCWRQEGPQRTVNLYGRCEGGEGLGSKL
jgi:ribosomal protein L34E